jgi:hypothetical protein
MRTAGQINNMTTKPTSTRSKSACHYGHAEDDTNIYEITFSYRQRGKRYIRAKSSAEARRKAARIPAQAGLWQDCADAYNAEAPPLLGGASLCLALPEPRHPALARRAYYMTIGFYAD